MTSAVRLLNYLTSPAVIGPCWDSFRVWSPSATIRGWLAMLAPRQCETYASLMGKAGACLGLETARPDPAGFHRAVDKLVLYPAALKGIETELQRLVEVMSRRQRSVDLRWHGRQLVAIDSSDLVLGTSPELIGVYGGPGAATAVCTVAHGRLSVAWDVRRKVILGWNLAPYRSDERAQLAEVTRALEPGTVVLLDRGYPSRAVISLLRDRDLRFIMRVPGGQAAWVCYRHLLTNGSKIREASVTLTGDTIPLRVILNPWRHGPQHGGKPQPTIVMTDLVDPALACGTILAAYQRRWAVETFFRELKSSITSVERWHSRSSARLLLEIQAAFIWFLAAALLEVTRLRHASAAEITSGTFVERVRLLRSTVTLVANLLATGTCDLSAEFTYLARYLVKPRPGRHFKRICRSPLSRSY